MAPAPDHDPEPVPIPRSTATPAYPYVPHPSPLGHGTLRLTADAETRSSIASALSTLEPGQTGAIVAYADRGGVSLAVMGRKGDHWTFAGNLKHEWGGTLEGSAAVAYSW